MNDMEIRQAILDELEFEPSVEAAGIGVAVKGGVVTLSGFVDNYAEKIAAEVAAKRVLGVQAVAMDIEVKVPHPAKHSDTEIARAALRALEWNTMVPSTGLKVKVEEGWVTLYGELSWEYQRDAAGRAVRVLSGVRGVTNLITVKPQVATEKIRERILAAFTRSAALDAEAIRVEATDGKVTLSGRVHSWNERSEAERTAWAAQGVAQVDNRIQVSL